MRYLLVLFMFIGTAQAQDIVIPQNDWGQVLSTGQGAELHVLPPQLDYMWVPSTTKPDYDDCSRSRYGSNKDPVYIGAAPNNIWVCTTQANIEIVISVSFDTGDFAR